MARRGVMTALQAALAGIGGAAGGYVQQEERKRRQQTEDEERKRRQALEEAGIRAEQRDILRTGGTQIAGMGEQVAGPVPSAIPLSGVGNAFAAAEQAGGPASSRGAMRQTVGGQTFLLPGAAETRAQGVQAAIDRAIAERGITSQFTAEDEQKAETKAFNALKRLGKVKGEFDPEYGQYGADLADERAIRRSRATQREGTEGPSLTSLRMTAIKDFRDENAREPTKEDEPEIRRRVNLYKPGSYATMEDIYGGGAEAPKPAAAPTAPSMTTPAGGMFARDMFASPVGVAQPSSQEEIRALAVKLAELNRGGFLGTIAAKDQYNRNAPKRAQVQAALDEARRRYRPIR